MRIGVLLLSLLMLSCGSQLNSVQKAEKDVQFNEINELVSSGNFDFSAYRATATKLGPVELTTNPNFLKFKNDSVTADLPFFGERYTGTGYGSGANGGIEFSGKAENLTIESDDHKKKIEINFSISNKQERFDVVVHVFSNHTTTVDVNSSQRSYISYRGVIKEVTPKS